MTEETSSTASATPPVDPPAMGTPAPVGATPQKPPASLTLEEALRKLAETEHAGNNAKEELERHRKKLSSYEKKEAEAAAVQKLAEEATLSEIERTKKQFAELQAQHDSYTKQAQQRIVRYEVERQATQLGIIDPDAAARLLDWSELEYDESGTPKNAVKLLKKLLESKPYLAPAPATPAVPTPAIPTQPGTPALPAMNPGRSTIQPPNTLPAGQRPTMQQAYQLMKNNRTP